MGGFQMLAEGRLCLKDAIQQTQIAPPRRERHLRGFMVGAPSMVGHGRGHIATASGRRGRISAGAGMVDVHRQS